MIPTEVAIFTGVVFLFTFGLTSFRGVEFSVTLAPFPKATGVVLILMSIAALIGILSRIGIKIWHEAKTAKRTITKVPILWSKLKRKKTVEPDFKYRPEIGD